VRNPYPFRDTITKTNNIVSESAEQTDIGEVILLHTAAAKNRLHVTTPSDLADYASLLGKSKAVKFLKLRGSYTLKASKHTADYNSAITEFFRKQCAGDGNIKTEFPS
jgi:phosphoribosylaminoimidazolecarboxamide formyltransferase/IMP cyclohydrolase